jgi:hypothetical protein
MRCPICNTDSEAVTLTDPCGECQEAIYECLQGYENQDEEDDPIVDEEFDAS